MAAPPTSTFVEARKLKGFHDFLPRECRTRQDIIMNIRNTALFLGFEQIDTPALEYSETLLGSSGDEADKETYQFMDHGERRVALRFDLTVPFARFVSENFSQLNLPFKRLQIGEVWRGEKPQKGRYRQFCQADVDIIGADSLAADVEVLFALQSILQRVVPSPHTLHLSNRRLLSALIEKCAPHLEAKAHTPVLVAIDKLAKLPKAKIEDLLLPLLGSKSAVDELLDVLCRKDANGDTSLDSIKQFLGVNHPSVAELNRFENTAALLRELAKQNNFSSKLSVNLSIARGLGYYTGVVYETTLDALPGFGSISSGGRYDNLLARFGKHDLAGVGGSIGVDRLVAGLEELKLGSSNTSRHAFIAVASDEDVAYGFSVLQKLRHHNLTADINLKPTKLANQFKYADKCQYQYVIVIGISERESNTISFKHLQSGVEQKLQSLDVFFKACPT